MTTTARPDLKQSIRSLPAPMWILFGGSFVNRFGSFVFTFLVLVMRDKGFGAQEAGLAVSAYGVGALAAFVGGPLADRVGRRQTIAISMFLSAAAMLALSQADALPAIIMLTALAGMASEMYRPASAALVTDLVPEDRRVTAFALHRLAINLGFTFGPATAGFLAQESFFYLFLGDAVTSIVFGIVALVALPETRPVAEAVNEERGTYRTIFSDRAFVLYLIATVVAAFVYFQSGVALPLHVRDSGLSTAVYGLLISLNGLIIIFLELPLASITQRFPAQPVIALGMLLTGAGFGLLAFAHDAVAIGATVAVWTLGEIVAAPIGSAYVAKLAPAHLRGRYNALWTFSFSVALVIAPAVGATVYDAAPNGLWGLCALLGIVAAAIVLITPTRRVTPEMELSEPGPEVPGVKT